MKKLFTTTSLLYLLLSVAHHPLLANGNPPNDSSSVAANTHNPLSADSLKRVDSLGTGNKYLHAFFFQGQVENLQAGYEKIKEEVLKANGSIDSSFAQNSPEQISLKVRVPATATDKFIGLLKDMSIYVDRLGNTRRDITFEFNELEARRQEKEKALAEWQEVLAKSKTPLEKNEARSKSQALAEELASLNTQRDYWNNETSYSYIEVTILPKSNNLFFSQGTPFGEMIAQSMANGWVNAQNFIVALFGYWPLCLALLLVFAIAFLYHRRSRKRSEQRVISSIQNLQNHPTPTQN